MSMNLRQIVKKYCRETGLGINAVRVYAKQLFTALKHLKKCGILHADIKPDNIVVNDNKSVLKLCDLGSASTSQEPWEITPYLVSRFYRAPEIILGLNYDYTIDTWSVGCTLAEIFTGKILFPGKSNNEMLRMIMEYRGKIPKKMLRKAQFRELHFDQDFNFIQKDTDVVSRRPTTKIVTILHATKDLVSLLAPNGMADNDKETRKILQLKDLLEKCLMLDPTKRITPEQALFHPFLKPT